MFDGTRLRQLTITVLPPQPPERANGPWGGPQRIRIEIVERRT